MADLALLPAGSPIPDFSFTDKSGTSRNTRDLRGKPLVVYFYPKDDTPGCTKEACGFRDSHADFDRQGVTVIGVSPDTDDSHERFRSKHDLPFGLASDPDHTIARAFGAWGPKTRMGRTYDGIHRVTFVVDADGKISKVYPEVKPEAHASEILQHLTTQSRS